MSGKMQGDEEIQDEALLCQFCNSPLEDEDEDEEELQWSIDEAIKEDEAFSYSDIEGKKENNGSKTKTFETQHRLRSTRQGFYPGGFFLKTVLAVRSSSLLFLIFPSDNKGFGRLIDFNLLTTSSSY